VNMVSRLRVKSRVNPVLILAVAIAAAGVPAIAPSSYAAGANRAESDQLVAGAEKLIVEAGQSDPVDSKKIHAAIDELHRAVRVDSRNDAAYVDLGFCYGVLRDADNAIDMYRTATDLNPSGNNFIELADVYLRVGDPEDALLAANAGIIKDPSNARLYNAKGMALNDLQRFDEAEEAWEKALRLNPNLRVAQVNLDALNGGPSGRGSISKHSRPPSNPTQ